MDPDSDTWSADVKPAMRHAFTFGLVLSAILVTSCPAETILMYGASQGSGPSFGVAAGEAGGAIAAGSALGLGLAYVAILAAGGQHTCSSCRFCRPMPRSEA